MKNENGISVESIFTVTLDFIDVNYTNLNQTIRYEQRRRGEWKKDGTCSECGVYSSLNKDTAYFCPNCGSDNRLREETKQ